MPLTVLNKIKPIKVTGTTTADTEILPAQNVFIKWIRWYNPTTSGDTCTILDNQGNTIIQMRADTANDTQMWPIWEQYEGIRCDYMPSGELYIHIR